MLVTRTPPAKIIPNSSIVLSCKHVEVRKLFLCLIKYYDMKTISENLDVSGQLLDPVALTLVTRA
jgi:hypothetical protein